VFHTTARFAWGRKPDDARNRRSVASAPRGTLTWAAASTCLPAITLPGRHPGNNCQEVPVNSRVVVTTPQGDIRIQDIGHGCVSWEAPWSSGVTDRLQCWTKPREQWTPDDLASWRSLIAEIKGTHLYALVLPD
jgi:hypothetical protein